MGTLSRHLMDFPRKVTHLPDSSLFFLLPKAALSNVSPFIRSASIHCLLLLPYLTFSYLFFPETMDPSSLHVLVSFVYFMAVLFTSLFFVVSPLSPLSQSSLSALRNFEDTHSEVGTDVSDSLVLWPSLREHSTGTVSRLLGQELLRAPPVPHPHFPLPPLCIL